MRKPGLAARRGVCLVLVAGALGAAACEANLETICYDGAPCVPDEGGTTTTTSTSKTTTSTPTVEETDIPCEVFEILEAKCHICHDEEHQNGAPIDLFDCSRFHEPDCLFGEDPRVQIATQFVTSDAMPAGPTDLTAEEKEVVLGWLEEGAPCLEKGTGCAKAPGPKGCYE